MSFYTSLSGLKAAQTDLAVISNNVANSGSVGFKKSRATFGELFSAAPSQSTKMIAGQGTRLNGIKQQFTQGTLESTDKTLDLGISGEGMFMVESRTGEITYTRNGSFGIENDRKVTDTLGNVLQLLPVDATTGSVTSTDPADATDFTLPAAQAGNPTNLLASVNVSDKGLVTVTYADGTIEKLGTVALGTFTNVEGLRPKGEAHWQATGDSGPVLLGSAQTGTLGSIRSGALERANVDITEELVALISAQRNFQANAKALETASQITQTAMNIRS